MIHHPKLLKDTITHAQEEYKNMQLSNQAALLAKTFAESAHNSQAPSGQMIADELQKLFDLLQRGAITQQEYDTQKNKLIQNT